MTRREMFLNSPFMRSPFMADVRIYGTAVVACVALSLDYTPWR